MDSSSVTIRLLRTLAEEGSGMVLDGVARIALDALSAVDAVAAVALHADRGGERGCAPRLCAEEQAYLAQGDPGVTVARTGEPIEIRDLRRDPRWPVSHRHLGGPGYSSLLCVPAWASDARGAITLYSTRRRRFSSDEYVAAAQLGALMARTLLTVTVRQDQQATQRHAEAASRRGRDGRERRPIHRSERSRALLL
jgi:GAF domain-containing protein